MFALVLRKQLVVVIYILVIGDFRTLKDVVEKCDDANVVSDNDSSSSSDNAFLEVDTTKQEDKWDCESILCNCVTDIFIIYIPLNCVFLKLRALIFLWL